MQAIKKFFSSLYGILSAIIAILLGLFLWNKSKREDVESKLENAKTDSESKVIDTKLDNNKAKMEELNKQTEAAKKDTKEDTDKDLADFFKKR